MTTLRNRIQNLAFICAFFTSLALGTAWAGQERGNGTDNLQPDEGSAWFLGETKTIRYCVDLAPSFGVSREIAEAAIEESWKSWRTYIQDRKVNDLARQFSQSGVISFATSVSEISRCDGSEDLRFDLGGQSTGVERQRAMFDNPTGFARRTAYDRSQGWGKGVIWVAAQNSVDPAEHFPDWSIRERLIAVLLHEIGHVLGCGHVTGTVMDENLSKRLAAGKPVDSLKEIEPRRKLWACFDCTQVYRGEIGWPTNERDLSSRETFETFMGRKAKGSIHAELKAEVGIWDPVLRLADDRGSDQVVIHFNKSSQRAVFGGENPIFKAFILAQGTSASFSLRSNGMVTYGTATGPSGKKLPVVLEGNATIAALTQSAGPIVIRYFDAEGEPRLLFGSRKEVQ